jgi:hypothetical protein
MWPHDDGVNWCVFVACFVFIAECVVVGAYEVVAVESEDQPGPTYSNSPHSMKAAATIPPGPSRPPCQSPFEVGFSPYRTTTRASMNIMRAAAWSSFHRSKRAGSGT